MAYAKPKTTVLAALAHDVVRRAQPFDSWADAAEALKQAAAVRKVHYDVEQVTEALRLVARTRPVFRHDDRLGVPRRPAPRDEARPYSRDEAVAFLAEWGIRL